MKTIPPSVAKYLGPINVKTTPFVNGTVASHNRPIDAPNIKANVGDGGSIINKVITIDLPN